MSSYQHRGRSRQQTSNQKNPETDQPRKGKRERKQTRKMQKATKGKLLTRIGKKEEGEEMKEKEEENSRHQIRRN